MAVAKMRKVTVIGYDSVLEDTIGILQEGGVLDIDADCHDLRTIEVDSHDERLELCAQQHAQALYIKDFLGAYHTNETAMAMFVTEKFHVDEKWYNSLGYDDDFQALYHECIDIRDTLAHCDEDIAEANARRIRLAPFSACPIPLGRLHSTRLVDCILGLIPQGATDTFVAGLKEISSYIDVSYYPADDANADGQVACVLYVHRFIASQVGEYLEASDFQFADMSEFTDTASREATILAEEIDTWANHKGASTKRAEELGKQRYGEIIALVNALESERERIVVREDFGKTGQTFVITGWTDIDSEAPLLQALEPLHEDIDVTLSSPDAEDIVPVKLKNPKWLRPFELLTDLYGRPVYGEIDPTPLLAPFFVLFFAICIGDVGYGLMLVVSMLLIRNRLDVAPGVKQFCAMMIYGGVAAIPVGMLFGSYWAIPFENLPPILQRLQVLDPLNDIVIFLGLTMALGIMQVITGIIVAAYDAFRKGDAAGAIGSQLSTLFFLGMITAYVATGTQYGILLWGGLLVTVLLQGQAVTAALGDKEKPLWDRVLGWIWLISVGGFITSFAIAGTVKNALYVFLGATVIGLVFSTAARDAVKKTLFGVYQVYGMTSVLNDTLSYTRLAALGLSGSLVGMVFNILAKLVWTPATALFKVGGVSIIGGILVAFGAALIFCIGHIFNVTINLLGAFVHPMRLQFVEFFGRFYEGGGKNFSPFKFKDNSLVFDAGNAGEEGGTSL